MPLTDLPGELAKKLPRYPGRFGRLAVEQAYCGRELGAALLWDAVMRALRSEGIAFALVVDALDDQAAAFYRHHGFVALGHPLQLVGRLQPSLRDEREKK